MTESQSNGVTESLSNETSDKNENSPRDCNEAEEYMESEHFTRTQKQVDLDAEFDSEAGARGDVDTTPPTYGVPNDTDLHEEMKAAIDEGLVKKLNEAELAAKSPSDQVELEYLRYFFQEADFGPADGDVRYIINVRYKGIIPEGYEIE